MKAPFGTTLGAPVSLWLVGSLSLCAVVSLLVYLPDWLETETDVAQIKNCRADPAALSVTHVNCAGSADRPMSLAAASAVPFTLQPCVLAARRTKSTL